MKTRTIVAAATAVLGMSVVLLCASPARATDIVLYQQNFNAYPDGTLMSSIPGWYPWGGSSPTIQGGVAQATTDAGYNAQDMLLGFTKLFSHNNTQARIEFDMRGGYVTDFFIGSGTASTLDFNYSYATGWENGAAYNSGNMLFVPVCGGGSFFDNNAMNWTSDASGTDRHYVVDLALSGTTVTWSATYDGANLIGGGKTSESFELTDPRGLNTIEWIPTAFSNFPDGQPYARATIDNLRIVDVTPEPATVSLLALGGLTILRKRRK